ncbi:MAG: hypothetical protein WCX32_02480 [Clostridia bacterium]|jgi:hypothetical protein|nr:hypothetical protein [Clostridia bacterium]MDD4275847.1 hypothetical protein [Clostridia bacterium]
MIFDFLKRKNKVKKHDYDSDTLILFTVMLFFIIPTVFIVGVWLKTGNNPITYNYSEEQLIALVSGIFSYGGTCILGFIALWQNIRLKKEIGKDRQQELAIKTLSDITLEDFKVSYNNQVGKATDEFGNNYLADTDKNFDCNVINYEESLNINLKFVSNGIKFLKGVYIKQIKLNYDFLAGKNKIKTSEDIVFNNIFTNNFYKNIGIVNENKFEIVSSIIDINTYKSNLITEQDKSENKFKNKKTLNKVKSIFANKEKQSLYFDINYVVCNMYNLKYDGILKIQCQIDENYNVSNFIINSNWLSEPYFNSACLTDKRN